MTFAGTIVKTIALLSVATLFAGHAWLRGDDYYPLYVPLLTSAGGLAIAIWITAKPHLAPFMAPLHAALHGTTLGFIASFRAGSDGGLVAQAILVTFVVLAMALMLYLVPLFRGSTLLYKITALTMVALVAYYVLDLTVLVLFEVHMPLLHSSTPFGIVFSIAVCAVASFVFVLDFDLVHEGVRRGAPKQIEWYAAFSLVATLIWLYAEAVRLVAKLNPLAD